MRIHSEFCFVSAAATLFITLTIGTLSSSMATIKQAKSVSAKALVLDDLPVIGRNVSNLNGTQITNFNLNAKIIEANQIAANNNLSPITEEHRTDIESGRLCVFIYDPIDENLCRYLIVYNCTTGIIFDYWEII